MTDMAIRATGAQPFVPYTNLNKDTSDVIWEFLARKQKDIVKLLGYSTGWLSMGLGKETPDGKLAGQVSGFATNAKNLLSAIEVPDKANKVRHAFNKFVEDPSLSTARNLFLKELTGLVNPSCDAITLGNEFVPLPAEAFRAVKGVNYASTLIGAANSAVEQVQKISAIEETDEKRTAKTGQYMLYLASFTSYVALGALGLGTMFLGLATAPWMFLGCLTSGLVFGIGGYFYEHIVNPEGKREFHDLNKVNHNLQGRIDLLTQPAA